MISSLFVPTPMISSLFVPTLQGYARASLGPFLHSNLTQSYSRLNHPTPTPPGWTDCPRRSGHGLVPHTTCVLSQPRFNLYPEQPRINLRRLLLLAPRLPRPSAPSTHPGDSYVRPIRQAPDAQRHITSTTWAKLQGSIFTAAQPHELCVRSRSRFHSRASTVIAHGETSFTGQPPTTAMHEDTNLTSTPPEVKPGFAQRSKLGRPIDIKDQLFNSAPGQVLTPAALRTESHAHARNNATVRVRASATPRIQRRCARRL